MAGRIPVHLKVRIVQIWQVAIGVCTAKAELAMKMATILALVITSISMWPSIWAASDGHKAELLAEWTARKGFIQTCEAVSSECQDPSLATAKGEWKRCFGICRSSSTVTNSAAAVLSPLLWIPISACLPFIQLRKRAGAAKGTRSRSQPTLDIEAANNPYPETDGEEGELISDIKIESTIYFSPTRRNEDRDKREYTSSSEAPQPFWYCCQCAQGPMTITIHDYCTNCQVLRCAYCAVEVHKRESKKRRR
ncbi:uncharacterized protein PG986_008515 [Apiospora aurea]|uniref:Uncharacterized protein n=1 Tax=Apiospora aurea TaxID=335848 RepID=A0ABR1QFX3_9PEZI